MGFFDRWLKRAEPTPAPSSTVTVPVEHRVITHRDHAAPGVECTLGGVWIAHLGLSSDEPQADQSGVFRALDALLCGPRPSPALALTVGNLSTLLETPAPALTHPTGMLVWTLSGGALLNAPNGPELVQRLLQQMKALHVATTPPLLQVVYLRDLNSEGAALVADRVAELGLEVRSPAEQAAILVEVVRPDGVVHSALVGAPRAASGADAKGHASPAGGPEPSQKPREVPPVERATALRRLLVRVHDGAMGAMPALLDALAQREVPLLVLANPTTRALALRTWQGGATALPVYPDFASLRAAVKELGYPAGTFTALGLAPHKLFKLAEAQGWTLAINLFVAEGEPVYIVLEPKIVSDLAGSTPSSPRPP